MLRAAAEEKVWFFLRGPSGTHLSIALGSLEVLDTYTAQFALDVRTHNQPALPRKKSLVL